MLFMRTTWRATCLGLLVLGPLLTACGGGDDGRTSNASSATSSSGASATGVYGQPTDGDAGEPTEVATDTPATPTSATPSGSAGGSGSAGTTVAPRLTYFGWNADIGAVEAGGIVPAIVESGGRCTLTMSRAGAQVEVTSEAVDNVTSTSCSEMVVTADRLSPGAWRTVLTYRSDTAQGVSEPVDIEVP
jgi:hypothetical protein